MKKFLKGLLILMLAVIPFITVDAKKTTTATEVKGEPITFYEFYGSTCPHCQELNEWIDSTLAKDKDYKDKYKLVRYEVWQDQTNSQLMQDVGAYLGIEVRGVPFMVIGKETLSGFSPTNSPDQIKKLIDDAYNANKEGKYEDVVAQIADGKIKNDDSKSKTPADKEKNDLVGYIITGVIAIIIIAIIFGRSKTSYVPEVDEAEEVVEVKEEVVEEKPVEEKTVVKKKSTTKKKTTKKKSK